MGQFIGFVDLGATVSGAFLTKNSSQVPTNADALPTFRVYSGSGLMNNGAGTAAVLDSNSIQGATNASPIVVTSAGHGLTTGARVTIAGVTGNTAANGSWVVTVIDANTFSLNGSTGNASYVSGGTWNLAGLYDFSLSVTAGNGYQQGATYTVLVSAAIGGVSWADTYTFVVT